MAVTPITTVISQFPPAPNSGTDSAPTFNVKANAFVAHQANVYTAEVNQWATEANALAGSIASLPTGAINDTQTNTTTTHSSTKNEADYKITSGTTSNGGWTKFPDGTMIQYLTGDDGEAWVKDSGNIIAVGDSQSRSFTQDFVGIWVITAECYDYNYVWASCAPSGTKDFSSRKLVSAAISGSQPSISKLSFQAIGRWK